MGRDAGGWATGGSTETKAQCDPRGLLEAALSSQAWEPWGSDSVEPQPVFIGEHQALISHLEGHRAQRGRCTGRTERKKLVS